MLSLVSTSLGSWHWAGWPMWLHPQRESMCVCTCTRTLPFAHIRKYAVLVFRHVCRVGKRVGDFVLCVFVCDSGTPGGSDWDFTLGQKTKTFSTRRRRCPLDLEDRNSMKWGKKVTSRWFKTLSWCNSSVSSCLVRRKNFVTWFVFGAGCSRGQETNDRALLQVRLKSWILTHWGNWPVVKPLSYISQMSFFLSLRKWLISELLLLFISHKTKWRKMSVKARMLQTRLGLQRPETSSYSVMHSGSQQQL